MFYSAVYPGKIVGQYIFNHLILTFALHLRAWWLCCCNSIHNILVFFYSLFIVMVHLYHAQLLFCLSSLSDRKPVESDDEIVVMVVPDYQMLQNVERIASNLSNDPVHPWTLLFYLWCNHFCQQLCDIWNLNTFIYWTLRCPFLIENYILSKFTTYKYRPLLLLPKKKKKPKINK